MIFYDARAWGGLGILFGPLHGSAIVRALPFGVLSVVVSIVLRQTTAEGELRTTIDHPFAYAMVTSTIAFLLVFRSKIAYDRFWEARTQLQIMSARWGDTCSQLVCFDKAGVGGPLAHKMVHLFSLLHATALQVLRGIPSSGDMGVVDWLHTVSSKECQAMVFVDPSETILEGLGRRDRFVESIVLNGTRKRAPSMPVLGELSDKEEFVLRERFHDLVFTIERWLMEDIVMHQRGGDFDIPPPVLSRSFQQLSDGSLAYMQVLKIYETPFPFPFAQLVVFVLLSYAILLPILLINIVPNAAVAIVMAFFSVVAVTATNEVARELEAPLGLDPNDLPLLQLQTDYNVRLASLLTRAVIPPHSGPAQPSRDERDYPSRLSFSGLDLQRRFQKKINPAPSSSGAAKQQFLGDDLNPPASPAPSTPAIRIGVD